jgi:hypothetical protein
MLRAIGMRRGQVVKTVMGPAIIMLVVTSIVVVMLSAPFPLDGRLDQPDRSHHRSVICAIAAPARQHSPFRTAQRRGYGNCERLILPVGPRGKAGTNVIICGRL